MARLSAHGHEIGRFFASGRLFAVMSDGTTLSRRPGETWKIYARKKKGVDLHTWREAKQRAISEILAKDPWREVRNLPSLQTLERWASDGVCNAVDGCRVEPDGTCPHGAPSWLLALGMI